MKRLITVWLMASSLLCAGALNAGTPRGDAAPREFSKRVPCPATGKIQRSCPGYVRDHIIPLACNGPDTPENLQWQTIEEGKLKDRTETQCWRYYSPYYKPNPLKRS